MNGETPFAKSLFSLRTTLAAAFVLCVAVFACDPQPTPPAYEPLFHNGVAAVDTGLPDDSPLLSARACIDCHRETHAEWSAGMHAQSFTDPLYRAGFAGEPRMWCVHCHSPLKQQKTIVQANLRGESVSAALAEEGINCAGCHIRNGGLVGAREMDCEAGRVKAQAGFGSAQFCAECHQFNFPAHHREEITYTDRPMQNTYAEWQASGTKAECGGCHYEGHRLIGPHTPGELAKRFDPIALELDGELLHVRIEVQERGHVFPSGDLFHSLAFELARDAAFRERVFVHKWARFFGMGPVSGPLFWNRRLVRNSGIRPEESALTLTTDAPAGPLYARLIYYFHDEDLGGRSAAPRERQSSVIYRAKLR